jgi:hypothetical protein
MPILQINSVGFSGFAGNFGNPFSMGGGSMVRNYGKLTYQQSQIMRYLPNYLGAEVSYSFGGVFFWIPHGGKELRRWTKENELFIQYEGRWSSVMEFGSSGTDGWSMPEWAANATTGLGVTTGIIGGNYGLTRNHAYRYAYGGKTARQLTALHFTHHMKVANFLGRVNIVTGIIGTYHSGSMALSAYQEGGWEQVNPWHVSDAVIGAGGVVVGGLAMFGIVSNPVGWGVGFGIGLYFGVRLINDLSTN